jgi:hypothetical protein
MVGIFVGIGGLCGVFPIGLAYLLGVSFLESTGFMVLKMDS